MGRLKLLPYLCRVLLIIIFFTIIPFTGIRTQKVAPIQTYMEALSFDKRTGLPMQIYFEISAEKPIVLDNCSYTFVRDIDMNEGTYVPAETEQS